MKSSILILEANPPLINVSVTSFRRQCCKHCSIRHSVRNVNCH